jgi:hypothetical protein
MQRVDIVDILLALVNLPLDPVSVEVAEEVVNVLGSDCVSTPFFNVESEQGLVGVSLALIHEILEVMLQVIYKFVI